MQIARLASRCGLVAMILAAGRTHARADADPPTSTSPSATGAAALSPPADAADARLSNSPRDSAAAAFRRASELRQQGLLAEALSQYEAAYQQSPEYRVLYFIGALNTELGRWAPARRAFELYLELGADQLTPERIAEVRVHLEELNKKTATLTLLLNVPGAQVTVDGAVLESTAISGLIIEPGEHLVRVSKPGFHPLEESVNATDGENLHLVVPLARLVGDEDPSIQPAASTGPSGSTGPAPQAETEPRRLPLWIPWSATGALAAGWMTTAVLAIHARSSRDRIERPGVSAERIDDARKLHVTLAVISDVLLASTLGSATLSAYLTWWTPKPASDTGGTAQPPPQGFAFGISGRF